MSKASNILMIGAIAFLFIALAFPAAAEVTVGDGGIMGRVTDRSETVGIAGAVVKVVDVSDPSHVYFTGSTNAQGYFQFTGASNTWNETLGTYEKKYLVYASVNIGIQTYVGYSDAFAVEINCNAWASVVLPLTLNPGGPGSISGRITFQDVTRGVPGAVVKVVDASNPSQIYYSGVTDSKGYYQFTGVNNTWDPASGQYQPRYMVYACRSFGSQKLEGYSNAFAVESDSEAQANVLIPRPGRASE